MNTHEYLMPIISDLAGLLGTNLVSVIAYHDIYFYDNAKKTKRDQLLVLVQSIDYPLLVSIKDKRKKWAKTIETPPIFMTKAEVLDSLDIFPMEFLKIKDSYVLLWGEDVLACVVVPKENLRLQIELLLKSKIFALRENVIRDQHDLLTLLRLSLGEIISIFQQILRLKNLSIKIDDASYAITEISKIWEIDVVLFAKIQELLKHKLSISKNEILDVFSRYLAQLDFISNKVDGLDVQ